VDAQGAKLVGPDTYSSEHVEQLSKIARRVAVKSGILANQVRAERGLARKPADGHNAAETSVHALRSLFGKALKYLGGVNPGLEVKRPRRGSGKRRGLQPFELMELQHVTATGGDDPELDELLLDFGIQTGARRDGALLLVGGRLYRSRQMIGIIEKYGEETDAPTSLELIDRLLDHAIRRGGEQCDPSSSSYRAESAVFWRREGSGFVPITSRHFDKLIARWQQSLPFANEERVGYHHVRHTMGAFLERRYDTAVKSAYLRHKVTDTTAIMSTIATTDPASVIEDLAFAVGLERDATGREILERLHARHDRFDHTLRDAFLSMFPELDDA
jgi:integrase